MFFLLGRHSTPPPFQVLFFSLFLEFAHTQVVDLVKRAGETLEVEFKRVAGTRTDFRTTPRTPETARRASNLPSYHEGQKVYFALPPPPYLRHPLALTVHVLINLHTPAHTHAYKRITPLPVCPPFSFRVLSCVFVCDLHRTHSLQCHQRWPASPSLQQSLQPSPSQSLPQSQPLPPNQSPLQSLLQSPPAHSSSSKAVFPQLLSSSSVLCWPASLQAQQPSASPRTSRQRRTLSSGCNRPWSSSRRRSMDTVCVWGGRKGGRHTGTHTHTHSLSLSQSQSLCDCLCERRIGFACACVQGTRHLASQPLSVASRPQPASTLLHPATRHHQVRRTCNHTWKQANKRSFSRHACSPPT